MSEQTMIAERLGEFLESVGWYRDLAESYRLFLESEISKIDYVDQNPEYRVLIGNTYRDEKTASLKSQGYGEQSLKEDFVSAKRYLEEKNLVDLATRLFDEIRELKKELEHVGTKRRSSISSHQRMPDSPQRNDSSHVIQRIEAATSKFESLEEPMEELEKRMRDVPTFKWSSLSEFVKSFDLEKYRFHRAVGQVLFSQGSDSSYLRTFLREIRSNIEFMESQEYSFRLVRTRMSFSNFRISGEIQYSATVKDVTTILGFEHSDSVADIHDNRTKEKLRRKVLENAIDEYKSSTDEYRNWEIEGFNSFYDACVTLMEDVYFARDVVALKELFQKPYDSGVNYSLPVYWFTKLSRDFPQVHFPERFCSRIYKEHFPE